MREILFRAWNIEEERYIYPDKEGWYNDAFIGSNGYYQSVQLTLLLQSDKVIVEQYTGLKDKNGKKIFEGDLFIFCNGSVNGVEWINLDDNRKPIKYIVKFENGRFNLPKWFMEGETDSTHWVEIIGNIWEDGE